jgi:hypothetical protein
MSRHLDATTLAIACAALGHVAVAQEPSGPAPAGEVSEPRFAEKAVPAEAVARGAAWLQRAQNPDGSFEPGASETPQEATALALLAFLGAGSDMRVGPHKQAVRRATSWLQRQINGEGCCGDHDDPTHRRSQAIAALAMVEVYGLANYAPLKKIASFSVRHLPLAAGADGETLAWELLALAAARSHAVEVDVPSESVAGRLAAAAKIEGVHLETAAAAATWLGAELAGSQTAAPELRDVMLSAVPVAGAELDATRALFLGHALYSLGDEHFDAWFAAVRDAFVARQSRDGSEQGAWPAEPGRGQTSSTALALLVLTTAARTDPRPWSEDAASSWRSAWERSPLHAPRR